MQDKSKNIYYKSDFHFLGERSYVQGSTLFEEALKAISFWSINKPKRIKLVVRSIFDSQATLTLCKKNKNSSEFIRSLDAYASFSLNNEDYIVTFKKSSLLVKNRVSYNEQSVTSGAIIDKAGLYIKTRVKSDNHIMRVLIALFKKYLNEFHPSMLHGKWIFFESELDLLSIKSEMPNFLEIAKVVLIGKKSARGKVYLNSIEVGTISFTRPLL